MPTRMAANRYLDATPNWSATKPPAAVAAHARTSRTLGDDVVSGVEVAHAPAVPEREIGPHHGGAAVGVEFPARAAAGVPHGAFEPLLQIRVPPLLHLRPHF